METLAERAEKQARKYRECAYWYHVGRQDAANASTDLEYPKSGAWDFAMYVADIARDFYSEKRTMLPSIPSIFDEFEKEHS